MPKPKDNPQTVKAGRKAYGQGLPPTACPYPRGTPEAKAWMAGWDAASREVANV